MFDQEWLRYVEKGCNLQYNNLNPSLPLKDVQSFLRKKIKIQGYKENLIQ